MQPSATSATSTATATNDERERERKAIIIASWLSSSSSSALPGPPACQATGTHGEPRKATQAIISRGDDVTQHLVQRTGRRRRGAPPLLSLSNRRPGLPRGDSDSRGGGERRQLFPQLPAPQPPAETQLEEWHRLSPSMAASDSDIFECFYIKLLLEEDSELEKNSHRTTSTSFLLSQEQAGVSLLKQLFIYAYVVLTTLVLPVASLLGGIYLLMQADLNPATGLCLLFLGLLWVAIWAIYLPYKYNRRKRLYMALQQRWEEEPQGSLRDDEQYDTEEEREEDVERGGDKQKAERKGQKKRID
ncbi:hypothetical protein QOT17_010487 [Balamuthia mandrillaris]